MAEERGLAMVTCTAPVNIAVIKYWGKRDNDLILPINSSLSVTLHQDQLKTTTTAAASRDFAEDRLWLNGEEADVGHPRLQACLREVKPKGGCRRIGVTATHLPRQHRAEVVVPERLALMMRHIRERDFEGFGQLAMRDSNQFHATCLDTFPPIFYLNDLSRHIIALAHRFNAHHGRTKVAYTFDAGPNAVIFTLADTVAEFVEVVRRSFPPAANGDQFVRGLPVGSASLPEELLAAVVTEPVPGAVRYILHTKPGPGPQLVDDPSQHLLGADGLPRRRA
ncbi:MVD1 decarboxylase, partial [Spizaetus tyrannus]|nr:MVD1 decarboxylase [Spizaetus tyrannus]